MSLFLLSRPLIDDLHPRTLIGLIFTRGFFLRVFSACSFPNNIASNDSIVVCWVRVPWDGEKRVEWVDGTLLSEKVVRDREKEDES